MTLRDAVTNWLDPVFVREEELAMAISRKESPGILTRRTQTVRIAGNNWAEVRVPASHEWFILSVTVTEPVDVGVGNVPKHEYLQFNDELNIDFFNSRPQELPSPHAQSVITWGIDLSDMLEDDGQATLGYVITAPLPKMWLKENYVIYMQRDGRGGIPTTTSEWRILYEEYRKVS